MSQDDQVFSVRLRRKNTGTPWGFRMNGGAEFAQPIHIQHVNPKSLAYRQGLRVHDRLLAVGNAPTHALSHEQVKMEIIRAGNELDFVVQRNVSAAGQDQPDSRPSRPVQHQQQYAGDPDEEPSEYRGYANPKVQSRSFKILQESLNYTEAEEEGIVLPSGHTPGEGVVRRAYNEGKRRMRELADINPRNFIAESPIYERGQNLLKVSEEDEEIIAKLKCSWKSDQPQVATGKAYTPGQGGKAGDQSQAVNGVDLSGSSVLAPAAAQQKYLQQAHAYYGDTNAPVVQTTSQPIVVKSVQQPVQASVQQTTQQTVQSTVQIPVQGQTQQQPRRRERKRQPKPQQAVTSPVAVTQASGFIPTTDTVSSVAEDLNLKHESTVERVAAQAPAAPQPVPQQQSAAVVVQPAQVQVKAQVPAQPVAQQVQPQVKQVEPVQNEVQQVQPQTKPKEEVKTVVVEQQAESTVTVQKEAQQAQPQAKPVETVQTAVVQQQAESTVTVQKEAKDVQPQTKPVETVQTVVVEQQAESTVTVQATQPGVDSVDATVELSNDVIREYGEKMAESVISESLQDANQSIKDTTDGALASKNESNEDTVSATEVKTQPEKPAQLTQEQKPPVQQEQKSTKQQEQKPIEKQEQKSEIKQEEPKVSEEGKSASKPVEEKPVEVKQDVASQPKVEPVDTPVEQVAAVETSNNEVVIEQTPASVDNTSVEMSVEIAQDEVSKDETKVEVTATAADTSSTINVEMPTESVQVSIPAEESSVQVTTSESAEVTVQAEEVVVIQENKTEDESASTTVEISSDVQSENVEVSIEQTEGSFVVGEAEESSFVFQVQEDNENVASEVQSETFDISVSEGTDESANITLDLSADVTIDASPSVESEATEVSLSLDSTETTETVIVQESKEPAKETKPKDTVDSPKDDKKPKESSETKPSSSKSDNDKKDSGAPKKAKFVDSQGGVSARLARFNLKKK